MDDSFSSDVETDDEDKIITFRTRGNPKIDNKSGYRGWVKTAESKQDRISANPEQVREKLTDFVLISVEEYPLVDTGTFIRYIRYSEKNEPKLRLGGYLIKNGAPEFWVLKSGGKGRKPVTWSVPLKGTAERTASEYYCKKGIIHSKDERTRYGGEVYEALKSGRYMLVETDTLEGLLGQALPGKGSPKKKHRTVRLEGKDNEGDSSAEERQGPRIKVRFRNDEDE